MKVKSPYRQWGISRHLYRIAPVCEASGTSGGTPTRPAVEHSLRLAPR